MKYSNGDTSWCEQWMKGKKNNKGVEICKNGERYVGEYKND